MVDGLRAGAILALGEQLGRELLHFLPPPCQQQHAHQVAGVDALAGAVSAAARQRQRLFCLLRFAPSPTSVLHDGQITCDPRFSAPSSVTASAWAHLDGE